MTAKAKLLLLLAAGLALVVPWWLSGRTRIVNPHPSGTNVIAFGDSLTAGTGADRGQDYPSQLSKLAGLQIMNEGVPGDTTADALRRLDKDVLAADPRIVIVFLGGNDLLQRMPMNETFSNLDAIVSRIQEKGALVVLPAVQNPLWGGECKSRFKKLAHDRGAVYVPDVLGGIISDPRLKADQIHPNGAGYTIVAERIYKALRPYLHD